jgi:HK97 family phage prohead protease
MPCDCHNLSLQSALWAKAFDTFPRLVKDVDDTGERDDQPVAPIVRMARRTLGYLVKQKNALADAVEAPAKGAKDVGRQPGRLLSDAEIEGILAEFDALFRSAVHEPLMASARAGAAVGARVIRDAMPPGVSFDIKPTELQGVVEDYELRLLSGTTETTTNRIEELIRRGVEGGQTNAEIARAIRADESGVFGPSRAEMIARSETARVYVKGNEEAWIQSEVVEGKQWETAAEACEFCQAAGVAFNARTVALGQAFFAKGSTLAGTNGGVMRLDYSDVDGAPLHPNCRCNVVAVLKPIDGKSARVAVDIMGEYEQWVEKSMKIETQTLVKKYCTLVTKDMTVNEGERSVVAIINTAAIDRDGEVVLPVGMDATDFLRNPAVFYNHNYGMPIGRCLELYRTADGIRAKTQFASRPDNHVGEWFPDTVFSLFQQGIIRGFSIGYGPIESRVASKKDIEQFGGEVRRVYQKWKLWEYSVAPLPANQEALAEAVSKGLVSKETLKALEAPRVEAVEVASKDAEQATEGRAKDGGDSAIYFFRRPAPVAPPRKKVNIERIVEIAAAKRRGALYMD